MHFKELLSLHKNIEASYSSLHALLTKFNIKSPKKRRRFKPHGRHERKAEEGLLIQMDATPFEWLASSDKFALHGAIDDATGKVYKFKVKSRWSGVNNVGYLMSKLGEDGQVENPEEIELFLAGNHTVKIGMAEQLCYADAQNSLFNPKTCSDFFCEFRELNQQDTVLLSEIREDLEIGFLKNGRGGAFGTTGSGKSNLVKVLASSVIDNSNYGLLIFDVHIEYSADLSQHLLSANH